MAKPLNDNLTAVRIETEDGDLLPAMEHAGNKFSELIKAVEQNQKAGKLVLTIDIKPSTAGTLAVKADVKLTKPKNAPSESLLWPTVDGNLLAEDPRQTKLPLRQVEAEQPRELKHVAG